MINSQRASEFQLSDKTAYPSVLQGLCRQLKTLPASKIHYRGQLWRFHTPQANFAFSASQKGSNSNKPAEVLLNQQTYQYLLEHTEESESLQALRHATFTEWPNAKQMQVSPEQGRYLSWLVATLQASKAIELGVFTGYSAICIAQALKPGGLLIACESDERPLALARQAFSQADVSHKIRLDIGKAMATLDALLMDGQQNSFDMAFVDADKRGYADYHEKLLQLVRQGGVIIYDNMLWYGAVADPQDNRKSTLALRAFNDFLLSDARVDCSLVPIGDGMALCRRL